MNKIITVCGADIYSHLTSQLIAENYFSQFGVEIQDNHKDKDKHFTCEFLRRIDNDTKE